MEKSNQALQNSQDAITLSSHTISLLDHLAQITPPTLASDTPRIRVSQTVSFFAILYEKLRNAVEFREEHLLRRGAIERILKRRFLLNSEGKGEGENLVRELLWARYLPNGSISDTEIHHIQTMINHALYLKKKVIHGKDTQTQIHYAKLINDWLTCEIEESLSPDIASQKKARLHFLYQVLKHKIHIKDVSKEEQEVYFYIACEVGFAKNDAAYVKYHLFRLSYPSLESLNREQLDRLTLTFPEVASKIEKAISNPIHQKLTRFVSRQVPPFRIFYTLINRFAKHITQITVSKKELWRRVELICREKYQETRRKLKTAAVRSIIYIFLTKMVFVLLIEYPLSIQIYKEALMGPLIVNALFPPLLMGCIVFLVSPPSDKNTARIYARLVDIINKDPAFETAKTIVTHKMQTRRPLLIFGFTIFYLLTFGVTFALIYIGLDYFRFNLISKLVFMFFLSIVTFFSYRITHTSREYVLEEGEGVLSPLVDFFFMPILSVGKFLSSGIAKINILILIFDVLIEAPFKLIFEIVEEWINFVKARKEEIV